VLPFLTGAKTYGYYIQTVSSGFAIPWHYLNRQYRTDNLIFDFISFINIVTEYIRVYEVSATAKSFNTMPKELLDF